MRPTSVTVTTTTPSAWIPLDIYQTPFNVGFGVVATGTITFKVQHTFDDVFDPTVTPTAFDHSTVTGKTTSTDGNYAFPVRAIRLNAGTVSGGTATLTILQGKG